MNRDCTGDVKSHWFVCPEQLSLDGSVLCGMVEEHLLLGPLLPQD